MLTHLVHPEQRLVDWQTFRDSLTAMSIEDQLRSVAEYWSQVPLNTWFLDESQPNDWPTPWEIIYGGDYCPTTVSYMMRETLHLSDPDVWSLDRFELMLIRDKEQEIVQVILVIDGQWVLNYEHAVVIEWDDIYAHVDILDRLKK